MHSGFLFSGLALSARETGEKGLLTISGHKELCTFEQKEIMAVRIDIIDNGKEIWE